MCDDLADVPVEDLFVIVVFGLNDFVPQAELPAELFDGRFLRPGGIQSRSAAAGSIRETPSEPRFIGVRTWMSRMGSSLNLSGDAPADQVEERFRIALRLLRVRGSRNRTRPLAPAARASVPG